MSKYLTDAVLVLLDELADTKFQNEALRETQKADYASRTQERKSLLGLIDELEAKLDALRADFDNYARHAGSCVPCAKEINSKDSCTCGLDAARRRHLGKEAT